MKRLQGELSAAQDETIREAQKAASTAQENRSLAQTVETLTAANSALTEELEALRAKRASAVNRFDPLWK